MLTVAAGLPARIIRAEKLHRKEALTHPYQQIARQLAEAIPESSRVLTTTRLLAGNLRLQMPDRLFVSLDASALFADDREHCFLVWDTEGSEEPPYLVRLWLEGQGPGSGVPVGAIRYFTAPYQYHLHRQMRVAVLQIR